MKTYYDKLLEIRQNPILFLGSVSLEKLKAFMDGYVNCSYEINGKYDFGKFEGFQEWIEEKYFHKKTDHSWVKIICFFNTSDETAFWDFFRLLDEYILKEAIVKTN